MSRAVLALPALLALLVPLLLAGAGCTAGGGRGDRPAESGGPSLPGDPAAPGKPATPGTPAAPGHPTAPGEPATSGPAVPATSGPAVPALAFGRLVHAEKVRLAEPIEFVVEGVARRETDVVLLALRVSDPHRFLPRGDLGEIFVLGGVVARGLAPPIFSPVVVLAVPAATPQPPDALWLAPAGDAPARLKREELQALERSAGRRGPTHHLPLPAAAETFRAAPARTFAEPAGLASYARDLGRKLEAR